MLASYSFFSSCCRRLPSVARLTVGSRALCTEAGDASATRPPLKPAVRLVDFSRLDVRVGRITTCAVHPENDSWYILGVDVGEEYERSVVSGLVKHCTEKELNNRLVATFCNLKKSTFRSMLSTAMLFCAVKDDNVELLAIPEACKPGDRIFVKQFMNEECGPPDAVINPKKSLWASIQSELKVENHIASYRNLPIITDQGKVTTLKLQSGTIS